MKTNPDFETQKSILINYIIDFSKKYFLINSIKTHLFFGKTKPDEWGGVLTYRLLDHFLK